MRCHVLLVALLLAGCGPEETDGPPVLNLGRDECVQCGMIINDARYAAATIVRMDGRQRALLFDDIGDQLEYAADHPELTPLRSYVHDHATRAWLASDTAHYVKSDSLHTPMGSGIVAFDSDTAAQAFIAAREKSDARLMTRDQLQAAVVTTQPAE